MSAITGPTRPLKVVRRTPTPTPPVRRHATAPENRLPIFAHMESGERQELRGLGQRLGLLYQDGGQPGASAPRRSRYVRGTSVSPRLDEDIDELLARVVALEDQLRRRG